MVHLLDVETQLGHKNTLFHFFILTKSENYQFCFQFFCEHILQKIWNFMKLTLVPLFKKMVFRCTIHFHQFLRSTGGECFWGSKITPFQASAPHWNLFLANMDKCTFGKYKWNAKTVLNTKVSNLVCFKWSRPLEIIQRKATPRQSWSNQTATRPLQDYLGPLWTTKVW